jgi:sugar-phosphatase
VRPEECVVVEDAPAGVAAGNRAGMRVLGIATTHSAAVLDTAHVVQDFTSVSVSARSAEGIRIGFANAK